MKALHCRISWFAGITIAAAFAVFPGCDSGPKLPPRAKVTGRVTLDGKALTTGMVTFVPDKNHATSGPPAVGGIDSTGHYELTTDRQSEGDGAVVGFHQVRVMANEPAKDAMQSMTPSLIPLRYDDEATSGLHFEVKAGQDNEIDLPLTTK